MPVLNTTGAVRAWIDQRARPAQWSIEEQRAIYRFWYRLGVDRPCGCPSDPRVFGHTFCQLAPLRKKP